MAPKGRSLQVPNKYAFTANNWNFNGCSQSTSLTRCAQSLGARSENSIDKFPRVCDYCVSTSERKGVLQGATLIHSYIPLSYCEVRIGEILVECFLILQVYGPSCRRGTKKFKENSETNIFQYERKQLFQYLFKWLFLICC